jgi:hypothetical protein
MEWAFLSDLATPPGRHLKRLPAGLPQHADQHRPESPVLPRNWVRPRLKT